MVSDSFEKEFWLRPLGGPQVSKILNNRSSPEHRAACIITSNQTKILYAPILLRLKSYNIILLILHDIRPPSRTLSHYRAVIHRIVSVRVRHPAGWLYALCLSSRAKLAPDYELLFQVYMAMIL